MRIKFIVFWVVVFFIGCKKDSSKLITFVDEYVIKDSIEFKNTLIGGLSGIDYNNGMYYMVIDDDESPRIITATIDINKDKISEINFLDVIHLKDSIPFFKENAMDLESVFVDKNNHINITSEGSIKNDKNPLIFSVNSQGNFVGAYPVLEQFKANSISKPRHNATFEASCESFDKLGFWIGMEGVLESDGEAPSQLKNNPPARITYYSSKTKDATVQFVYPLDYIERPSKGGFNVNGITAMLEYAKNEFLVVERAYQSGYGIKGNVVRIYKVVLTKDTTNTIYMKSLKEEQYLPIKKELVFDFDMIRDKLTDGIIDNIEGITLGPELPNGNQSIILVSDDNFQKFGKQLNQFILLEINH